MPSRCASILTLAALLCVCVAAPVAAAVTDSAGVMNMPRPGEDSLASTVPSHALNISVLRSLKKPVPWFQPASPTLMTRDFLTGDWGGIRSTWMHSGVETMAAWYNEAYANLRGGRRTGAVYYGVGIASFDVHSAAAGLWPSGQFHATVALTSGRSLASEYVGSVNATSYYDNAAVDGLKLFELWYEHRFMQDVLSVRAGMIYPFVLFGALAAAGPFQNGAFQAPSFLGSSMNRATGRGFTTAFVAAPLAIQLRYLLSPDWQILAQIQDGFVDPSGGLGLRNEHGINPHLSMIEGAEILAQVTYRTEWRRAAHTLPGNFSFGLQAHTATFSDLSGGTQGRSLASEGGAPASTVGNFYAYLIGEQTLARIQDGLTGVTVFAKVCAGPASVNPVSSSIAAGLRIDAPFASRPRDSFGIGLAISRFSDRFAQLFADAEREAPTHESVLEMQYSALLAPWLLVRPCVQWIFRPGGVAQTGDALVFGITTGLSV
jgi:porin